ncbi:hypothetical protein NE237_018229 [Protea cynaroides]|uniref:Uncharacterized protein n=1 Tax=Protea cynaroides TaxID=273540 RepID=A0A9Q0K9I8_9MAGN|nr:hypothetical protein NE237_018229 [Protea cynaroides]
MSHLGNNLIIEFPGVSWLLWLHLLVMFLISLLLLSYLGIHDFHAADDQKDLIIASDHLKDHWKAKQVENSPSCSGSNCFQDKKVNEDEATIKGHLTTSTRTKLNEGKEPDGEEEIEEMEEYSSTMVFTQRIMNFSINPCNYLEQVLKPFLKCLGLESTYQKDSSTTKQGRISNESDTRESIGPSMDCRSTNPSKTSVMTKEASNSKSKHCNTTL